MMNIDFATRKQLDALSKEVFGSSSRWQKLIDKGYTDLITEEVEEEVPSEVEGEAPTKKTVTKPVLKNGAQQFITKYYTIDSAREYMIAQKAVLDNIKAQIAKHRADQEAAKKAAELAKDVHNITAGSAT